MFAGLEREEEGRWKKGAGGMREGRRVWRGGGGGERRITGCF